MRAMHAARLLALLWVLGATAAAGADCPEALSAAGRLQAMSNNGRLARDALITLRRQAQDWKNLLLRGSEAGERQTMLIRFDNQSRNYQDQLEQLRRQLGSLNFESETMAKLDQEQLKLDQRYRAALAKHGVADLQAAAAADREVQGSDVASFRALEQLITAITAKDDALFQQLRLAIGQCGAQPGKSQ